MDKKVYTLDCGIRKLYLSSRTHVMGILNVTPDSFSDGGKYLDTSRAVARAIQMAEEGADIIDIGGESTRPGSKSVSLSEELRRIIPVIEKLKDEISIPISVDTQKSDVAKEAINAGAHIINDISGLRNDSRMKEVAAEKDVPVIIMHMQGEPATMQENPEYIDLMDDIHRFMKEQIQKEKDAGITSDKIIVDPGIGFGKKWRDNFKIIQQLNRFEDLNCPLLIGVSRKSFIGYALDTYEKDSIMGTAAAVTAAILNGAHIIRVHDVAQMVQVSRIADAIISPDRLNQKDA